MPLVERDDEGSMQELERSILIHYEKMHFDHIHLSDITHHCGMGRDFHAKPRTRESEKNKR